ncbi:uncharacterized protein PAC_06968 [Phialocephala subalpina]|uniref:Uncharacterized protein n=1 Tax=Phialocephala subalpina TaxID=576137 RepID=A0A1L7WWF0_9HELO|nr:uncharacterized protein PAC_06968 [Phialocephala subalpina]
MQSHAQRIQRRRTLGLLDIPWPLHLPNSSKDFAHFAFSIGYKRFANEIQHLNGSTVLRSKMERAWKTVVEQEYRFWNPRNRNPQDKVRMKARALEMIGGSDAWSNADIELYWRRQEDIARLRWNTNPSSTSQKIMPAQGLLAEEPCEEEPLEEESLEEESSDEEHDEEEIEEEELEEEVDLAEQAGDGLFNSFTSGFGGFGHLG